MAWHQPDYQISLQKRAQSIVIVIFEIQVKRLPFLLPKENFLKKQSELQRRSEVVRPSRHLTLKSNPIGLNYNINREYVLLVFLLLSGSTKLNLDSIALF